MTNTGIRELFAKSESEMKTRVERMQGEMGSLRTGRANPRVLDGIKVDYYGNPSPIKQVAALSIPDARTIEIRPWDPACLEAVEKAIQKSDLGIQPQNDGKAVRLNFPSMTEERRREMVKMVRKMAEEFRVALRNIRRDLLDKLRRAEKSKEISEDDYSHHEKTAQKLTDSYIKRVDEFLAAKEKEITTI